MHRFDGKTVLITGGTSGIGAECARAFAREGANVVITGRNQERGNAVASEAFGSGRISFERLDVSKESEIQVFAEHFKSKYGDVDILMNNAGIYPAFGSFKESENSEWENVFSVNVNGMIAVCRCFMPQLEEKKGVIINNASIAGLLDFNSGSGYAYAASKSAVIKFTKMLAKNYAKQVRINCICPGVIDTPLYLNLNREKMIERIPSGKLGCPADVASVVTFLASDEAGYIYGAILSIDGGMTL